MSSASWRHAWTPRPPGRNGGSHKARMWLTLAFSYQMGCPNPAARSVASSGPRPAQQAANVSSITTAGTERIPRLLARRAMSGSRMSRIVTSQEGQARRLIISTASVHMEHPALKISICRLLFMREPLAWKGLTCGGESRKSIAVPT